MWSIIFDLDQYMDSKSGQLNIGTIFSPLNFGPPSCVCRYCGALFWYEEHIDRRGHTTTPKYTKCCREGRVILPPYKPPPEPLYSLLTGANRAHSSHFFENIRYYNSMFAFTSMGVNVIDSINDGRGPYIFKISGQLCHRIGSLLPEEGRRPEYAQLYIFDTENELRNRLLVGTYSNSTFKPNKDIVAALIQMFNSHNHIVRLFRAARDRLSENGDDRYCIRLFGSPDKHGDIFSAPIASEIVGLVIGDLGEGDGDRDLLVEDRAGSLHRVHENHCKFMAMQYPILFPYGEDGYHENISYRQCPESKKIKRKHATMLEVFSYRLHDRSDDFNTPLRCKRATQAYFIDLYCCMEESRLSHYRTKSFQKKYRAASHKELRQCVNNGTTEGSQVGQVMILPSSHVGSPRYLYQNYLDCVAICQKYGCPDLFITFTSNPLWSEVTEALARIPGQHPTDRADIVNRVFHMKLDIFMDDIVKEQFFGPVLAVVYTIEFQKRGLPHVHLILWLDKSGPLTTNEIDNIISAQLPDPSLDPIGFEAVSSFMIHGPCGDANKSCSCMVDGQCSKYYPKEYCDRTTMLQNGHIQYARPKNGLTTKKNDIDVDNRSVVPHNVDLCVKHQAHINVERVNRDGMEKYLFKYFCKGFDCAKVGIQQRRRSSGQSSNQITDEIRNYLESRCVTPNDAAWRLLEFEIHYSDPSIERLPCHLPFDNFIVYTEEDNLEQVLDNPNNKVTKLTEWFQANKTIPAANQFTYAEFPEHFTWHGDGKYWDIRRGHQKRIGRVAHIGPNQGDSFYLRMLLHIVKGAKSFSDIRTVEGHQYPTFQAACQALGLLGDDREWSFAITNAAHWALPYQLRELFVTLLLFCHVGNPCALFEEHVSIMGEDFAYQIKYAIAGHATTSLQYHVRSYVLNEINRLLKNSRDSLAHFSLPEPTVSSASIISNNLLLDEKAYDLQKVTLEAAEQLHRLNQNQKHIYRAIMKSVEDCIGQTFCLWLWWYWKNISLECFAQQY